MGTKKNHTIESCAKGGVPTAIYKTARKGWSQRGKKPGFEKSTKKGETREGRAKNRRNGGSL